MPAPPLRRAVALAGLAVLVLMSVSCSSRSGVTSAPGATASNGTIEAPNTTVPTPARVGAPGELISAEPGPTADPFRAWRISYHSRGADNRDIAVTGLLVTPPGPAPDGGFPLITWGHPTTGTADACAPSRRGVASLPFPDQIVGAGWAVVATDYEGLGSSDPHPYLVGASAGHTVLDAARAATQVGAGVTATSPITIWGFSQGGHSAAFAGELAQTYAPELAIKGAVIAAPVSSVAHFARRAEDRADQMGVLVTIVASFAHAYPRLDPATVFTPTVVGQMGELEHRCIGEINEFFDRPIPSTLKARATEQPEYQRRFAENEAGQRDPRVPVLVLQGAQDDIVDPADTRAFVDRYCALGVTTRYVVRPETGHGVFGPDPVMAWTVERFAGTPAFGDCPATAPGTTDTRR